MARRKGRDGNWRALAIIGALAAMVLVMAVTAFTLHKSSPLIAGRPQITTYQPASTGEAVVVPLRSERSIDRLSRAACARAPVRSPGSWGAARLHQCSLIPRSAGSLRCSTQGYPHEAISRWRTERERFIGGIVAMTIVLGLVLYGIGKTVIDAENSTATSARRATGGGAAAPAPSGMAR
jgi:hypothetical protein